MGGMIQSRVGFGFAVGVVLLLLTAYVSGSAQQMQEDFGMFPLSKHAVWDISFPTAVEGRMVVQDRTVGRSFVFRTSDGGKSWTRWAIADGVRRLFFLDAQHGWALKFAQRADGNISAVSLLHTDDGGKSWSEPDRLPAHAKGARNLAFLDQNLGWVVGAGPTGYCLVLKTINGGGAFQDVSEIAESMRNCSGIALDRSSGVWIYGGGVILHSEDRGLTWSAPVDFHQLGTVPEGFTISAVSFSGSGENWFVGQDPDGLVLRTDDLGQHWMVALKTSEVSAFTSVSFWDSQHGCVVDQASRNRLLCTVDGGKSWSERAGLPTTGTGVEPNYSLIMLKSGLGWAVRGDGYVYRTTDFGSVWQLWDPLCL